MFAQTEASLRTRRDGGGLKRIQFRAGFERLSRFYADDVRWESNQGSDLIIYILSRLGCLGANI